MPIEKDSSMITTGFPVALRQIYKRMRRPGFIAFSRSNSDRMLLSAELHIASKTQPAGSRVLKAPIIPLGYQLYLSSLRVAPPYQQRAAAQAFAQCSELSIELEAGGEDPYNDAAVKVIGISRLKRVPIGLIPRCIAEKMAEDGVRNHVRAQLEYISQHSDGCIAVFVQLIIPNTISRS